MFWIFGCLIVCSACEQKESSAVIYPIDSLLNAQVNVLASSKAFLKKESLIEGETSAVSYTPGSKEEWNREIEIFRQISVINKRVNELNYIIDDGLFDPRSNLTVKAFSAKEELPIRYLRIFYQEELGKPRKIEALYRDENPLSKTARLLTLVFAQIGGKVILTQYSVEGGQKMIFADTVAYVIRGDVVIK